MKKSYAFKPFLAAALVAFSTHLQAQLAITEVMSSATGNFPDWWELTNLGTNNVDLTGYSWRDDSAPGFIGATNSPFNGVIIHTNESIIFSETKGTAGGTAGVLTAADFRTWWGISNSVQVIMVGVNPGLGAGGDSVRLWSTNWAALGANTNGLDLNQMPDYLVDKVDLGAATTGFSLYYNPTNGLFSTNSVIGLRGAFKAATSADVGSPGVVTNLPAPLGIVQQPTNAFANVGGTATLSLSAYGLPKPHFQWLLNGQPLALDTNKMFLTYSVVGNYAIGTLIITNLQVTNGGQFRAVLTNGFQSLASSNAILTVNTGPLAPFFTQKPAPNLSAYPGQTVTFRAGAFGNPPPNFLWLFNSNTISGQTDSQYVLPISDTNQSGYYTVIATNSVDGTNAIVFLNVTPKPNLRITEVFVTEATNAAGSSAGHNDWWELSNFGDFAVNLRGYVFDDNSFSIAAAYTITNDLTIAPGESIIFAEEMNAADFRAWWGPQNLRPNLQIIYYRGSALSFSGMTGDALTLWNPVAATEGDFLDSVSVAINPDSTSFDFNPFTRTFSGSTPGGLSVAGVNGAFVAPFNGTTPDIGSPGTIINVPVFTSILQTNGVSSLAWFTQPNWTNTLQFTTNLTDGTWFTLTNLPNGDTNLMNFIDPVANGQRFYRVNLTP